MLLSALSFACLLVAHVANGQSSCPLVGIKPLKVTEKSNYVVDYFSGQLLFTYAINKCTATSIIGSWHMYSCIQSGDGSWSVKKTKYTDSACSKGASTAASYAQGDSAQGEVGYFECTGSDNYAEVEVSIYTDCSESQVVAVGLGGCTHNTPLLTEFYCDSTQALVQLYIDPTTLTSTSTTVAPVSTTEDTDSIDTTDVTDSTDVTGIWINNGSSTYDAYSSSTEYETTEYETTEYETTVYETTSTWTTSAEVVCSPSLYCAKWTFVSKCQPVAEILGNIIYGKFDSCFIAETTPSTTELSTTKLSTTKLSTTKLSTTESSFIEANPSTTGKDGDNNNNSAASSLFVITNLVFALVVTFFSLF